MSDPQGLRYDAVAEDYELGRAAWPADVVEGVEGVVVLDLAAGTGKLTRLLVDRFPRVIAVEPLAGMRAVLERVVPAAESLAGSAEAIPLADASVDAAFVAEAFHWFDPEAATAELARVLRPGGPLRLLFNMWRRPFRPSLGPAARELLRGLAAKAGHGGGAKIVAGEWKRGFAGQPFTPLEERHVEHVAVADRDGAVAQLVSTSAAASLPGDERLALAESLRRAIRPGAYRLEIDIHVYEARRL
jgi:SAM-dependent methyltransferase